MPGDRPITLHENGIHKVEVRVAGLTFTATRTELANVAKDI